MSIANFRLLIARCFRSQALADAESVQNLRALEEDIFMHWRMDHEIRGAELRAIATNERLIKELAGDTAEAASVSNINVVSSPMVWAA